ncbi:hypothetical protein [Anaeromyxobacter terrae]|uniref:hypothetical protein n=1 Tax=Anaeromyxobacter terrae TaxID=2925406 RepID=UPI001F58CC51|nr:hypothetical protein [Anaeromyxobacter sp. SG22]
MKRLFGGDWLAGPVHDALRDRAMVEQSLPAATRAVVVDGVRGWLFPVTTTAGDLFQLFLWFDGAVYQVTVASPDVSGHDPHACHLFPHGRICLSADPAGGMPTLQAAYAKSVLWANGFSEFQRTGAFPF